MTHILSDPLLRHTNFIDQYEASAATYLSGFTISRKSIFLSGYIVCGVGSKFFEITLK
jgi:hypothetical protein